MEHTPGQVSHDPGDRASWPGFVRAAVILLFLLRWYWGCRALPLYFRFGSYVSTTTPEPNVCE